MGCGSYTTRLSGTRIAPANTRYIGFFFDKLDYILDKHQMHPEGYIGFPGRVGVTLPPTVQPPQCQCAAASS
jgi:hypothetical protein